MKNNDKIKLKSATIVLVLTLKAPITTAADDIFSFFSFSFVKENES